MRYLPLLLLAGCASDWTVRDTALEVSWQVFNAIDATQTTEFQYRDDLEEGTFLTRQILGSEPNTSETYQLFAAYAVAHLLISNALPKEYRIFWQAFTLGYQCSIVHDNRERLK